MYEQHFGLKSRPFGANAEGTGVFVGPQQTRVIKSLTKGLGAADAVVTVTGPVGVGKTTIIKRALESISPGKMVAWVGRMHLAPDEVLELLLTGFGVNRQTKGTIQRFAAFRRMLGERAAAGTQVVIVVEDAHRIGTDALLELEALTAADAGDSNSANIILMGQANLNTILSQPELARLRQRNRLRQEIRALNAAEVDGYLKHCIRGAGGDYESLFEQGVSEIIYNCSEGVPRIINTLCETALTSAMEENQTEVSASLMLQVAADAFGYEEDFAASVAADESESADTDASAIASDNIDDEAHAASSTTEPEISDLVVAELINDTQPSLHQLDDVPAREIDKSVIDADLAVKLTDLDDSGHSSNGDEDVEFSLDAALSVEAEETNVMPGITPNLDQLAAAARKNDATSPPPTTSTTENIPTLSDSMRIDVEADIVRAGKEATESAIDTVVVADTPAENIHAAAQPSVTADATPDTKAARNTDESTEPDLELKPLADLPVVEQPVVEQPVVEQSIATTPVDEPVVGKMVAAQTSTDTPAEPGKASMPVLPASDYDNTPVQPAASMADVSPEALLAAESAKQPEPVPALPTNAALAPKMTNGDTNMAPPDSIRDLGISEAGNANPAENIADSRNGLVVREVSVDNVSVDEVTVDEVCSHDKPMVTADRTGLAGKTAQAAAEKSIQKPGATPCADVAADTAAQRSTEKRMPDIDALEAALDAAKNGDFAVLPAGGPATSDAHTNEPSLDIPEITLDDSLPKDNPDHDELRRVAEQIGAANSLEDISDVMAETIFGSQAFDEIAAAVVANPPASEEASPVMLEDAEIPPKTNGTETENAGIIKRKPLASGKIDEAAAQRLDMVKALNNGASAALPSAEEIEISSVSPGAVPVARKPSGPQPEPIENQINTSMTQTLKALSSAQSRKSDAEASEEKKAGGLFSRFRK